MTSIRIGNGWDFHRFGPGQSVRLGTVDVPHTHSLIGDTDADIVLHALVDALCGALGQGDIGAHLPKVGSAEFDRDSANLVRRIWEPASEAGWTVSNVSLTIICEAPKIRPHVRAMESAIADLLGIDPEQVNVGATTTEKLGFIGREEGMAVSASLLLVK